MPIHYLKPSSATDPTQLLIWEVTESEEEMLFDLNFTDFETKRFNEFHSLKRKMEFLAIKTAINSLLNSKVNITYDNNGKPFLSNSCCNISISHSGKWVAVAAHATKQVGIDIECPSDKFEKVYKRFLSSEEQTALYSEKDIRYLQIAWSAKECLYKIIGKEAVDFAKQLEIFPFAVQTTGTIQAQHIPSKKIYTLTYILTSAYTLVYCTD